MSIERNVQTVKDFFAAMGRGNGSRRSGKACWPSPLKTLNGSFPARIGRWLVRIAGMQDCKPCSRQLPKRSRRPSWSTANMWRRGTGFLSSPSPAGRSKPQTGRGNTTGSSPSPSGTASCRVSGIYRHASTGVLKNALDQAHKECGRKPFTALPTAAAEGRGRSADATMAAKAAKSA